MSMKKILFISMLTLGCTSANAQENYFKFDNSIGAAMTFGKLSAFGVSVGAEPKFFFNPNISVGLRFEANVLFGAKINTSESAVKAGLSGRYAALLKGEYYFGEGNTKPFVGLMGGYYVQATLGAGVDGQGNPVTYAYGGRSFGGAPEVGVTFGNFRLSAMYHLVAGKDQVGVTLSTGSTEQVDIGRGYFIFQIGWRTFGIGDK